MAGQNLIDPEAQYWNYPTSSYAATPNAAGTQPDGDLFPAYDARFGRFCSSDLTDPGALFNLATATSSPISPGLPVLPGHPGFPGVAVPGGVGDRRGRAIPPCRRARRRAGAALRNACGWRSLGAMTTMPTR
ncbi:MAG: hypothetical protein ACRDSR_18790 [Pseudonocardiaceae bacterium]